MDVFFQFLFWFSGLAIVHSYVLYPIILKTKAKNKNINQNIFSRNDIELPHVSILMALFNEEEVIAEKINSILKTSYPTEKLEILIGSDNSTDKTNEIVEVYSKKNTNIGFTAFKTRQGKPNIINQLQKKAKGTILIITDANVIFSEDTIFEMLKHFKNENIGLVDTQMIHKKESISKSGISVQESSYINREVGIKQRESIIWGTMMGPFGGCYSLRKNLYKNVPINYLVDDFYINMNVFVQGKDAINSKDSIVYEDVSNNLKDEFKRKIRIATGNFQNLSTFSKLLFSKKKGLSFSFISHKVLRWLGPFFLITILISNILLLNYEIYQLFLILFFTPFIILILDFILKKVNINISIFRFITHFYSMNLALFIGFFKFISGVKTGIWQPTKRNQSKQKV